MSTALVVEILLGVLTAVIAGAAFYGATRATRAQSVSAGKAVDAGAFDRARQIYEGALDALRDELAATRSDLIGARSDLLAARAEISGVREESLKLRQEIARLREEIARLRPGSPPGAQPGPA